MAAEEQQVEKVAAAAVDQQVKGAAAAGEGVELLSSAAAAPTTGSAASAAPITEPATAPATDDETVVSRETTTDVAAPGENASAETVDGDGEAEADPEAAAAARVLAEHNALADLFDLVREQSRAGSLASPSQWADAGLVPAHMTPDEFEMFAYEYLEEYLAEHKAELAAEKAEAAAKASTFHSATRAVGVPPKIPNRRLKQIEADEARAAEQQQGATSGDSRAVAGDDSSAAVASAVSAAPAAAAGEAGEDSAAITAGAAGAVPAAASALAAGDTAPASDAAEAPTPLLIHSALSPERYNRANGIADPVDADDTGSDDTADTDDDRSPFANLHIPDGYRLEQVEGEYVLVPDPDAQPREREIDCRHIAVLVGQHSYYLYDTDAMAETFAHWAFLAAEDNPLATFVDCVREEGRTYPRPLDASDLKNPPFRMTDEQIADTWEKVRESGEYPDIQRTTASNGDVYYYSTLYMQETLATSLAEWASVGHPANS